MTITATDGMRIPTQLFLPRDLKAGERRPALIFFHGGSRRQMLTTWHYNYYYRNAYAMNQWLASQGYIVLSVNYRSGIGYGLEFREALNYGASGGAEFNDVMGAGLYLKSRPTSIRRASACGAARTAAISPRWACHARRTCSPPAWTSTACTTGTRASARSCPITAFTTTPTSRAAPSARRRSPPSTPGSLRCC